MTGVFEKPRFIREVGDKCVGPDACNRCRQVCPVAAVSRVDGRVAIDQAACPGCGICAAVCPTGALQYRHPASPDLLTTIHARIADARLMWQTAPAVVFRQAAEEEAAAESVEADEPTPALTFELTAVGSVGPEVWLNALAYGAAIVAIQLPAAYPARLRKAIADELCWVTALLEGLGHSGDRIRLLDDAAVPTHYLSTRQAGVPPADFPPIESKRSLIRRSAAHLACYGRSPKTTIDLPEGAPFGAVALDAAACTLCMACAGACPTGALTAPGEDLALAFLESRCVQCAVCRTTCPERALEMVPRMHCAPDEGQTPQRLFAQDPVTCGRCGRPFAPPGLIAKILERLDGHRLYRREADRQRLFMCRDCRIREMFSPSPGGAP